MPWLRVGSIVRGGDAFQMTAMVATRPQRQTSVSRWRAQSKRSSPSSRRVRYESPCRDVALTVTPRYARPHNRRASARTGPAHWTYTPAHARRNGVRLWVWWAARQEGFVASIDTIDASFLHPVVIRQLHLKSMRENAFRVDLTAMDASVALNFKHILLHMRGRIIRNLSIRELHVQLHRTNPNLRALSRHGWATLQRLLPENLSIAKSEMRVENGPTLVLLRGGSLSVSETEAGRFNAAELMVASPWLRQTFSQLRGATHWETNRLTVGGLTLNRGLDLQSGTADFSHLGKQRVGLQFELDAFGGKIRGNISHEWRSEHFNWKIAGGASDISLTQTSDAFGFADRVDGLLHAANFTFRGNLAEPDHVTASLWGELTGLTWRNRTAEAIMLGAAVYSRKIQLQQLYIRQRNNQFTLSGEAAFPANASGWLTPDFRGDISASINDLGQFAELFGASPEAFAGKVAARGRMHAHERTVDGDLALTGDALKIFRLPVDSLTARIGLESGRAHVDQLELKRGEDFLRAQGKIDLAQKKSFTLSAESWCRELGDYALEFPIIGTLSGALSAKLTGAGDENSFSSTVSGQTDQFSFSAQSNWRSDAIAINSLKIKLSDSAEAEVKGTIDLTDPKHFRANLSSANELRCDGPFADKGCGNGLDLREGETGLLFSEITIDGRDLTLRESSQPSVAQSIKLCDEGESGQPIQINIPKRLEPPPPSSPSPAPLPSPAPPPP